MALYLNTNMAVLRAQSSLASATLGLDKTMQRLSTGFRINSAADDPAGLQIATRMTSQIQGLEQAVRNANDGISVAQVAEGALQESTTIIQRIRQLAVQSQNGINSDADRAAIQKEVSGLMQELDRISETTEFAGQKLLNGQYKASFLVGANAGQNIDIKLDEHAFNTQDLGLAGLSVADSEGAAEALEKLDTALEKIGSARADLGAVQNRFQSTIRNQSNMIVNVSAARSRIMDTDYAKETAELAKFQILQQVSLAMLVQAKKQPEMILQLLG